MLDIKLMFILKMVLVEYYFFLYFNVEGIIGKELDKKIKSLFN